MKYKEYLLPHMKVILENMHILEPNIQGLMDNMDLLAPTMDIIVVYLPQLGEFMGPMLKHIRELMPFVEHPQFPLLLPYLPQMMPKM
jgi:hypothetical protein